MRYDVFGPFEMPGAHQLATSWLDSIHAFWADVDAQHWALSQGCGCFVLSARGKVVHIGTALHRAFDDECFCDETMPWIHEAMRDGRGVARLHFIARGALGEFDEPSHDHHDIPVLAQMLKAHAHMGDGALSDGSITGWFGGLVVPGLVNSPSGADVVGPARSLLGVLGA